MADNSSSPAGTRAIGGYFELEAAGGNGELYPDAIRFQSARAGFEALLCQAKPRRIWMPRFNCGSMFEAAEAARVEVRKYAIGADLYPQRLGQLEETDFLLYVNYFGVCDEQVARLLRDYSSNRIILDHSQAFHTPPSSCLATLYSPRKFFGVPDGGYLVTRLPVASPGERDIQSMDRMRPLLIRFSEGPEAGHLESKKANLSLKGQPPMRMSVLTHALLLNIDYSGALKRRNANFNFLNSALGGVNRFPLPAQSPNGPLCYPFLPGVEGLHEWLIGHRVFVPRYWPGVHGADGTDDDWGPTLARSCVPLPCDQRYDETDMNRVVDLVLEYLTRHTSET